MSVTSDIDVVYRHIFVYQIYLYIFIFDGENTMEPRYVKVKGQTILLLKQSSISFSR